MTPQPLPHFFLSWEDLGAVPLHALGHKEASLQAPVSWWEDGPRAGCVCQKCCSLCQGQVGLGGRVQDAAGSSMLLPQSALIILPSTSARTLEMGCPGCGEPHCLSPLVILCCCRGYSCWDREVVWHSCGDTLAFIRLSSLIFLSSHTHSALLFLFKTIISGRKVELLPQTQTRMYWDRPTDHLIHESSFSQAGCFPRRP